MIPPPPPEIIIRGLHNLVHVLAHSAPHLLHAGLEKGAEKYNEVKERRRAQQERSMGEPLAARFPAIEKAAEELRQREPHLTKSQAIAKATFLDASINKQPQASDDARNLAANLGVDLSQVKGSGPGGLITPADVLNAWHSLFTRVPRS
jgi:pyruvate/2-oxoglutarate dehydrogenase complex dihydrolipoamide acyltransferase (E2) component